jgi:hypothetical protein
MQPPQTQLKKPPAGTVVACVTLVCLYGIVALLILPRWPDLTLLFGAVGAGLGLGIGALYGGQRGAMWGGLFGGAAGPLIWILGIIMLFPGT